MPETLDPIPQALPSISDAEYQSLVTTRDIHRPRWSSRHSPLKLHQGYTHINEHCVTCKGTGSFRWLNRNGDPATYLCPCLDQWTLDTTFAAAQIEPKLRVLSLDDSLGIPESSYDFLEDALRVEGFADGVILLGPSGSGKTLIGSLIMRAFLAKGYTSFLTRIDSIRDLAQAKYRNENPTEVEERFERKIRGVDLLVIDEAQSVFKSSNFMESTLNRLLSYRNGQGRPTIVNSQKDVEWLKLKFVGAAEMLSAMDTHEIRGGSYKGRRADRDKEEEKMGLTRPRVLT